MRNYSIYTLKTTNHEKKNCCRKLENEQNPAGRD